MKIRFYFKSSLIVLLFIIGLFVAAIIHPALRLVGTKKYAKQERDRLRGIWYKCFNKIVGIQITTEGEPLDNTAFVVSNHISWVDIAVLGSFFSSYFVAKSDILGWPVVGYLAKEAGTIFIRRGDKKQVMATAEKMVWLIKQNSTVIVFPEGTTTKGDMVLPFHASLFQPALLTKSSVQPVALHYLGDAKERVPFVGDDAFLPHLIRILAMEKVEVRVVFLPLIHTAGKTRNSISDEANAMILGSVAQEHRQPVLLSNSG